MSHGGAQSTRGVRSGRLGVLALFACVSLIAGCVVPVHGEPEGGDRPPDAGGKAPGTSNSSGESRAGSDAGAPEAGTESESSTSEATRTGTGFDLPKSTAEGRGELRLRLSSASEHYRSELPDGRREAERLRGMAETYDQQVDNPLFPEQAVEILRLERSRERARSDAWMARGAALRAADARLHGIRTAVGRSGAAIGVVSPGSDEPAAQSARNAQKKALRELEEAKSERERETNTGIQKIIDERSELLGQIADISRAHHRRLEELAKKRESLDEMFARRQERIETKLQEFSKNQGTSNDLDEVDELFDEVRSYRRDAMEGYAETADRWNEAKEERAGYREQLQQAKERLQEIEQRSERIASENLRKQKLALARTTVEWRRRQVEKATSEVARQSKLLDLHARRSEFYSSAVERLLPWISDEAQNAYYSVWNDTNWQGVGAAFQQWKRVVVRRTEQRINQLEALPERLDSPELWGWVLGLVWRLLLLIGVVYGFRAYGDRLMHRLIRAMLQRGFFRARAAGTIKFGECLLTLSWPLLLFGVSHPIATYLSALLPELEILHWVVHLFFIYWIPISTLKLFVYPRAYRDRDDTTAPAPDLGRLSRRAEGDERDVVDVVHLELETAHAVVSSRSRYARG